MKKVYLDYAATTPVAPEVKLAMDPFYDQFYGNPMALHSFGQKAREEIEAARETVSEYFGFDQDEIIFTSGATESNNLAIKGIVGAIGKWAKKNNKDFIPHVITTPFEHHCLFDSVKELAQEGAIEVTYLKLNNSGIINPEEVKSAIKPNTVLVSIMYVNNEIGTVQPISEVGGIVQNEKINRKQQAGIKNEEFIPVYFHSDITQGINYLPCKMSEWNVDAFSFSAHKIYGPKGVGALGIRKGVLIEKIQHGGNQEFNLRAGTHNVTGIVGLSAAIKRINEKKEDEIKKVKEIRDYFWEQIQKDVKGISLNGSLENRSANNLNISFDGVEGESMLMALDMAGVACSTGSACSSESLEPSHVLLAIGLSHPQAHGSLRFTFGNSITKEDVDYSVGEIKKAVERLREISGYKI